MGAVGLIYTNSSANQPISFRGVCQKPNRNGLSRVIAALGLWPDCSGQAENDLSNILMIKFANGG
jgi:hypothetical protein